ncbi:mucin-5AC-like [Xenopus tropicalis]|uniref:Mucin-5AC-like n=1 Tax=Xenopus tropicalis TaxID=8364 RepID=A0A8J1JIH0_XENTR|nr:mucin-5AC-like [Xenopus tropicalis]
MTTTGITALHITSSGFSKNVTGSAKVSTSAVSSKVSASTTHHTSLSSLEQPSTVLTSSNPVASIAISFGFATSSRGPLKHPTQTPSVSTGTTAVTYTTAVSTIEPTHQEQSSLFTKIIGSSFITTQLAKSPSIPSRTSGPSIFSTLITTMSPTAILSASTLSTAEKSSVSHSTSPARSTIFTTHLPLKSTAALTKISASSKRHTSFVTKTTEASTLATTITVAESSIPYRTSKMSTLSSTTSSGPYTTSAGVAKTPTGPSKVSTSTVSSKAPTSSILTYEGITSPGQPSTVVTSSSVASSPVESSRTTTSTRGPLKHPTQTPSVSTGPTAVTYTTAVSTIEPTHQEQSSLFTKIIGSSFITTQLAKSPSIPSRTSGPSIFSTLITTMSPTAILSASTLSTAEKSSVSHSTSPARSTIFTTHLPLKSTAALTKISASSKRHTSIVTKTTEASTLATTITVAESSIPYRTSKMSTLFSTTSSGPYTTSTGVAKTPTGPSKVSTSTVSSKAPTSSILTYEGITSPGQPSTVVTSSSVASSPVESSRTTTSSRGTLKNVTSAVSTVPTKVIYSTAVSSVVPSTLWHASIETKVISSTATTTSHVKSSSIPSTHSEASIHSTVTSKILPTTKETLKTSSTPKEFSKISTSAFSTAKQSSVSSSIPLTASLETSKVFKSSTGSTFLTTFAPLKSTVELSKTSISSKRQSSTVSKTTGPFTVATSVAESFSISVIPSHATNITITKHPYITSVKFSKPTTGPSKVLTAEGSSKVPSSSIQAYKSPSSSQEASSIRTTSLAKSPSAAARSSGPLTFSRSIPPSTPALFSKVLESPFSTTEQYSVSSSTLLTEFPGKTSEVSISPSSPAKTTLSKSFSVISETFKSSALLSKGSTSPEKAITISPTLKTSKVSSSPLVHTTTGTKTTGYFLLTTTHVKAPTALTMTSKLSMASIFPSKGPLTTEKVSVTSLRPSKDSASAFITVTTTAKPTIAISLAKTSSAQNTTSGIPSIKSTISEKLSGFTTIATRLPTKETNYTKSSSFPSSSAETSLSHEVTFEELTKEPSESLSTTKKSELQTEHDFGQYTSTLTITSGKSDAIQKPSFSKCVNITCSKNGELNVETVKCPQLLDVTCNDGKPPMKIYDQDGCCYFYECRSCVGFNGQKRNLGETWTEHCQECTCDKKTATIICMPTECPELDYSKCDKPWLEPFVLLTEKDRCCGSIECRCLPLQCNTTLGDCPLGYAHVNTSADDCCITYECRPMNVCLVEGAVYQVGNSVWTSASCQNCECTDKKDPESGFNIVDCYPILCAIFCPQGFYYQESSNSCCGQCVQVSCPVKDANGTVYLIQPGETHVLSNDNCTHHTCENIDGLLVTSTQKQICPELNEEECEPDSVMKGPDGCCNICRVPKTCRVQTKQTLISYKGCSANVTLSYCKGACLSFEEFSLDKLSMNRTCGCCQELEAEEQNIDLTCSDGESNVSFNFTTVRRCGCTSAECTPLNPTVLYQTP